MPRRSESGTYVGLVRGINLGGRNRVAMEDLRALVRGLGSDDVRTYVQSGNVVFRSKDTSPDLVRAIEASIRRTLGLDVTVLVRTKGQLAEIINRNPFVASGLEPAKLHVTFLAAAPDSKKVRELSKKRFDADQFEIVGDEIYLYCPDGYGRTKLSNAFFERQLAVAATTRNWKTVTALAELAKAEPDAAS